MKLNHAIITGTILVGAGAYNTYQDYQNAPKEQKTRTLVRNATALSAAALAVFSADRFLSKKFNSEKLQGFSHKVSTAILNNKIVRKLKKKVLPKTDLQPVKLEALSDLVADCTKDVMLTASAGLAGISAGVLVDKILYRKKGADVTNSNSAENVPQQKRIFPKSVSQFLENPVVSKVANEKTRNLFMNTTKVFEAAGFIQNPFDKPSVVLSSLDMAREKSFQKIVEQTASGIVAEALIPTLFISVTNSLTKNKSFFVKIPALAASFALGDFVGEKVGEQMTHEIRDEFFDNEENEKEEESTNNKD